MLAKETRACEIRWEEVSFGRFLSVAVSSVGLIV